MSYWSLKKFVFYFFLFILSISSTAVFAQHKAYTLFNPVPKSELREMETDRPNVTETPITVDAGHIQYESAPLDYTKQYKEDKSIRTYTLNQMNFTLGITSSTAFQLMLDSYVTESERTIGSTEKSSNAGLGDMTLRIKQNLMGNDGGNFAIALLPYLKLPTAKYKENNRTEMGLSVPMSIKLPAEWTLDTQVEVDRLQESGEKALHTEFLQSVSLSHKIVKDLDGLAETYYTYGFKKHEWNNYVNAALQYGINANCKLDAGLNYGIQHEAERSFFLGLAYRF